MLLVRPEDVTQALGLCLAEAEADDAQHDADWERYKRDVSAWIDECVWTYDPRTGPDGKVIGAVPFKLYEFQTDYLVWLEDRYREREDALTEKSRDMGVSWCSIAWFVHHWMFDDSFQALFGSYVEHLTDNWLLDSLFGKAEFIVDHLPDWQRRRIGWEPKESRRHLTMVNRASGSTITGQSANPRFARQGRYSGILLDEFSMWEHAEEVLAASADSSPFRCFIGTPKGKNTFGRLRFSGRIKVFTLHWRRHPLKDDVWYASECARRTPEEIAQELDISYDKSVSGRVYPEWDEVKSGAFPYVHGWPLFVAWDFGINDETALVWWQRNPVGLWRVVDCYSNRDVTLDFYIPFVTGEVASGMPYGYSERDLAKIESHRGWGAAVHYGDPAGNQRNQVTGSSVIGELGKHRIYVQTRPDANTFEARWQTTKLFLRRVEGWNAETCLPLHDAMTNARFPAKRPESEATSTPTKPIHDWTSHFRTAVEYAAVNAHGREQRESAGVVKPKRQQSAFELRGIR